MTQKQEYSMYKHYAKEMIKKHLGISIPMKRMVLLEGGAKYDIPDYVMIEDCKTGIEYQATDKWAEIYEVR